MKEKKILIITYYWPPAGGPGVQRWLKFTKYLPEFGWKPSVYIPENPSYPIIDKTLEKDIPKDLEIFMLCYSVMKVLDEPTRHVLTSTKYIHLLYLVLIKSEYIEHDQV